MITILNTGFHQKMLKTVIKLAPPVSLPWYESPYLHIIIIPLCRYTQRIQILQLLSDFEGETRISLD